MMVAKATIFLDTDILLHFKPPQDVDWPELVSAETVRLVIVPIIVRQLDKQKDTHHRKSIRKRAASRLVDIRRASPESEIRQNVVMRVETIEPQLDLASHQLRRDVDDDYFLASVIEYWTAHSDDRVYVATADTGLMLKCGHHTIPIVELSDELRLPEESAPDALRVRELEAEVRALRHSIPDLRVCADGGSNQIVVKRPVVIARTPEYIAARMEAVKARFCLVVPPPRRTDQAGIILEQYAEMRATIESLTAPMNQISEHEIRRYNREVEEFYDAYEEHLRELAAYDDARERTVTLKIGLANGGTAPGEDIDVFLYFPDGIELRKKAQLPKKPKAPKPPAPPRATVEVMSGLGRLPGIQSWTPPPIALAGNVSGPSIRYASGFEVEIHVRKLKHKMYEPFDELYLTFPSWDTARSLGIHYRINASNVPKDAEGTVHLIVSPPGDLDPAGSDDELPHDPRNPDEA